MSSGNPDPNAGFASLPDAAARVRYVERERSELIEALEELLPYVPSQIRSDQGRYRRREAVELLHRLGRKRAR